MAHSITILTWLWGQKYGREYVNRLAGGIRRNLKTGHRFVVMTDGVVNRGLVQTAWDIPRDDYPLLGVQGCFARLRAFDPEWQKSHNIDPGDKILNLDLDLIITGRLEEVLRRPESFVILSGANSSNPCPYNGSVWMLTAGTNAHVWHDFSLAAAKQAPYDSFPDDQAWFAHTMPDAGRWEVGAKSGIFAMHKPGWPGGDELPRGAKIVAFPGKRDPSQFTKLPWVRQHWTP